MDYFLYQLEVDSMEFICDYSSQCANISPNMMSRSLMTEQNSNLRGSNSAVKTIIKNAVDNKWKKIFWEKNAVDPSMLRLEFKVTLDLLEPLINVTSSL